MKKILAAVAAVMMILSLCACSSNGNTATAYKTARDMGCSFEYPSDWSYSFDSESESISVSNPRSKDFADNLYIITVEEDPNLTGYSAQTFEDLYKQSLESFVLDSFNTYNRFTEENTFAVEINGSYVNQNDMTVYFRQYILNKNGKGYSITFSTLRRQFPSAFEHMVETLEFYTD